MQMQFITAPSRFNPSPVNVPYSSTGPHFREEHCAKTHQRNPFQSKHKAKQSREAHLGGPTPSSGTRARSRTVTARTRWRCGEGARRATSRTPGATCHESTGSEGGSHGGRKRRRCGTSPVDAGCAAGGGEDAGAAEEGGGENARYGPRSGADGRDRHFCAGEGAQPGRRGLGRNEVWGLAADGDLLGRGQRVVGPQIVAQKAQKIQSTVARPRRLLTRAATCDGRSSRRCRLPIRRLSAREALLLLLSSPPAPRESAPDSSAEINSSPLPSRGGRRSCVRTTAPPLSCLIFFSGLIRQAVASPLASASSWSAAETSRGFLLVLRVGFVLNSHRIDPPSKIENSFAQYFFFW
jgi:hypothetical protein